MGEFGGDFNAVFKENIFLTITTIETAKEKKKAYQCFFTPSNLADRMVSLAPVSASEHMINRPWILDWPSRTGF
jgi:hypothetical protein